MSVEIEVDVVIERPRDQVWAYVTDVAHDTAWTGGLLESTLEGDGFAQGATLHRVSKFLSQRMEYTIAVTSVQAPSRAEMISTAGPFPMTVTYLLDEVPEGTRMAIRTEGKPEGYFALIGPVLSVQVRGALRTDLNKLKQLLEAGP